MKKEKVEVIAGSEFTVDFTLNRNGGKPVCRVEGIIGFIDGSVKDFVTPSSTWIVSVESIHEKYVTVKPLLKIRTAKDNSILIAAKIATLVPPKKERVKIKKNYQYKSFAELQKVIS